MFKIINNKLQLTDTPLLITNNTNIEVVGHFPTSSVIYCLVTRKNNQYSFPLFYEKTIDEGNLFSAPFFITDVELNYFKTHIEDYSISFVINNFNIEGAQPIVISPKLTASLLQINDLLLNKISSLTQIICNNKGTAYLSGDTPKQGMIPMATGKGDYVWDFPFNDTHLVIENLSKLVNQLTEEIRNLVTRVNDVELKLTNHIYEQQIL